METITLVLVGLAGLIFGSFFNVVIYRLPRGLNLSKPPSACPGCGASIKPYDNIPVLSYVLLRGKCRSCGRKISPVYPAVEALTAAGFILVYLAAGRALSLEFLAGVVFTSALIVLGFIDTEHQILPDAITMPGLVLALAYAFFRKDLIFRDPNLLDNWPGLREVFGGGTPFREALLGAVLGAGFLLLIYAGYLLVRKKEGLGMGDVTMLLMIGATLGPLRTLLTLILASLVGSIVGIYLIVSRGKEYLQFAIPFGTFLAPAAFITLLYGEQIVGWYLGGSPL